MVVMKKQVKLEIIVVSDIIRMLFSPAILHRNVKEIVSSEITIVKKQYVSRVIAHMAVGLPSNNLLTQVKFFVDNDLLLIQLKKLFLYLI